MEILKDFLRPEIIWFLIGIALLTIEFAIPGLVIFFFGVGACVVAITCLVFKELSINSQLFIFIGASVMSLVCLRKWIKGVFIGHVTSRQDMTENASEFVGQKVTVISTINSKLGGKIELHGTNWQAEADEDIAEGDKQQMIARSEGEKLKRINEADGRAIEIEHVAMATAKGIREIATAINDKGGKDAVNLRIAEQYLGEFGKLAKTNNSIIIPANLSDIAGMIKAASSVLKDTSKTGAA